MKLEATNVEKVFAECIKNDESCRAEVVTVAGITKSFTFFELVLCQWENDIIDLLSQLPEAFLDKGDAFHKMGYNRENLQWTTDNAIMEKLVVLGIAIGRSVFYLPKSSQQINVPYVVIKRN